MSGRKALKVDHDEAVSLLKSLVQIPSITGDEIDCARFVRQYLNDKGFDVTWDQLDDQRANVIGKIKGQDPKKSLIFNGHIDVVPPGNVDNWKYSPFGAEIHDGRLYGRGFRPDAVDMRMPVRYIRTF